MRLDGPISSELRKVVVATDVDDDVGVPVDEEVLCERTPAAAHTWFYHSNFEF